MTDVTDLLLRAGFNMGKTYLLKDQLKEAYSKIRLILTELEEYVEDADCELGYQDETHNIIENVKEFLKINDINK